MSPLDCTLGANLYQILPLFGDFGAIIPQFKSHNGEIWCKSVDMGLDTSPRHILWKLRKGIGPLGADLKQKFNILTILADLRPHF